jgi:orsellinic acid C2-O-methyltransferase
MDDHHEQLLAMIGGSWIAQALHVAAALNLADALADGPLTVDDVAKSTGTHPDAMRRLLRALCTLEVCCDRGRDRFGLAALGQLLRSDHPTSLRAWTIWWGTQLWQDWGGLLHSVTTGEPARLLTTGTTGFGHLSANDGAAAVFHLAMAELTRLSAAAVLEHFDFASVDSVTDLGGGSGEFLLTILDAHPHLHGTVFDQPHAQSHAEAQIARRDLKGRCAFQVGDFFHYVPEGADAYLLKSVIHDWPDDRASVILQRCRAAMDFQARLLLVERMLPDKLDSSSAHRDAVRGDLTMLVALGAQERSSECIGGLLRSSGFQILRSQPIRMGLTLVEAAPI